MLPDQVPKIIHEKDIRVPKDPDPPPHPPSTLGPFGQGPWPGDLKVRPSLYDPSAKKNVFFFAGAFRFYCLGAAFQTYIFSERAASQLSFKKNFHQKIFRELGDMMSNVPQSLPTWWYPSMTPYQQILKYQGSSMKVLGPQGESILQKTSFQQRDLTALWKNFRVQSGVGQARTIYLPNCECRTSSAAKSDMYRRAG